MPRAFCIPKAGPITRDRALMPFLDLSQDCLQVVRHRTGALTVTGNGCSPSILGSYRAGFGKLLMGSSVWLYRVCAIAASIRFRIRFSNVVGARKSLNTRVISSIIPSQA